MRLDEIHPCISLFERVYARQNTFLRIFPRASRNQQLTSLISLVHPCTNARSLYRIVSVRIDTVRCS